MKRKFFASFAIYLLLLVAFVSPLLGMWILSQSHDPIDEAQAAKAPVWTTAPRVIRDGVRMADLALTWAGGEGIRAPAWTGIVTALPLGTGTSVSEGAQVIEVEGIPRIAVATPAPFYRSLAAGASGQDVQMLNALLDRLGQRHATGPTWTAATDAGVRSLAHSIGLQLQSPATFDPTWTVWIPSQPFVIGSLGTALGEVAPAQGETFIERAPSLVSAKVVDEQGSAIVLSSGRSWAFTTSGTVVPVAIPTAGVVTDAVALATLAAAMVPGTETVEGAVGFATPMEVTSVPVSSVLIGNDGGACVWVREAGKSTLAPTAVTVIDGDVGATFIAEPLPDGAQLLVNPVDVLREPACSL